MSTHGTGGCSQLSPVQTPSSVDFTTPRAIPGPKPSSVVQQPIRPRVLFENVESDVQQAQRQTDVTGLDTQQTPSDVERLGVRSFLQSQASSSNQNVTPSDSTVQPSDRNMSGQGTQSTDQTTSSTGVPSNDDFNSLMGSIQNAMEAQRRLGQETTTVTEEQREPEGEP